MYMMFSASWGLQTAVIVSSIMLYSRRHSIETHITSSGLDAWMRGIGCNNPCYLLRLLRPIQKYLPCCQRAIMIRSHRHRRCQQAMACDGWKVVAAT